MGLFEKIFGSRKVREQPVQGYFKTLNGYTPTFYSWRGSIYESELVRSAIRAKAEHISKMNVQIYGAAKPKLQARLRQAPNEWQTWSQFLARLSTIYDTTNTAFIVPVLDAFDDVTGIATVLPSECSIVQYNGDPFLQYRFGSGGVAAVELDRCGIMVKHQYRDDFLGESNQALDSTMDLISIQQQGIKEGVKSSATFRFMAEVNNFTDPDDLAKERKRFSALNLSKDGGGLLLFPSTYKNPKQIDSKPFIADADQMELIQTNVFNYFGVNEAIIQGTAKSDELDAFYNGKLEPFAIQLSEVLTKILFTSTEQSYGAAVHVTSNRLQYMSVTEKLALVKELGDRGMLLIDEGRELLNYAPLPDGKGQKMAPIRGEYYNAVEESEGDPDGEESGSTAGAQD